MNTSNELTPKLDKPVNSKVLGYVGHDRVFAALANRRECHPIMSPEGWSLGRQAMDNRPWSSLVLVERKRRFPEGPLVSGLEPSELFGQVVGNEGLAGRNPVDTTYFLNGLFQKIL